MIISNNLEKAKQEIKNSKEKPLIVKSQNEVFNRKILEYGNFSSLLLNYHRSRDGLKSLDSDINHVLAKIAKKNNVSFAYILEELRSLEKKDRAIFLSRIRQNIKICRKSGAKIKLFGIKDSKDAFSLMLSLGSSTNQAKEAIA